MLAGAATTLAGALAAAFTRWSAAAIAPGGGPARFLLALVLLFLLPGWALLAACRLRASLLEAAVLATLLGMALTAGGYWLLMRFGAGQAVRWLPAVLGAGAAGVLLARAAGARGAAVLAGRPRPRWIQAWLLGLVAAALVPLALRAGGYRDLALRGDGEIELATVPDMIFHLAYAHELARAVPPQLPFAAGAAGSYHYGADLLAAALGRTMGLEIADLEVRYLPTLWLALLAAAAFCCFRALLRCGEAGALLASCLVLFGEDLSFLPGLAHGPLARGWSEAYFSTPTVHSLYNYNPMLPGLALLFAALLAIARWAGRPAPAGGGDGHAPAGVADRPLTPASLADRPEGTWWPIVAVLLAALCACKVFAAALALAAVAAVAFARLVRHRETRWLKLLAVAALATLPLLGGAWRGNLQAHGGPRLAVTPRSAPYVQQAVAAVGLAGSRPGRAILAAADAGPAGIVHRAWSWLCFAAIGLPLFMAGSLGARLWGVPATWRAAAAGAPDPGTRQLVAVMIVLGAVLTLGLDVSAPGLPPGAAYNNSVWFYVVAKYLAWGFAVESAWTWSRRPGSAQAAAAPFAAARFAAARSAAARSAVARSEAARFAAAAVLMLALSLPGALQLLAAGWPPLRPSPPGFRQAAELLSPACAAGAVVLAPEPLASLLVGVPGCRSPLALPPLQATNLGGAELARRGEDLAGFWQELSTGRLREDVLRRYRVRFVVATGPGLRLPAARYGGSGVGEVRLQLRLKISDLAVYEAVDASRPFRAVAASRPFAAVGSRRPIRDRPFAAVDSRPRASS